MTTLDLQSSNSEQAHRKRLRLSVLLILIAELVYVLFFSSGHFKSTSDQHGISGILVHLFETGAIVLVYLAIWWRLSSPDARIPVGVALLLAAHSLYRIAYGFTLPPQIPPVPPLIHAARLVFLVLDLAMGVTAIATIKSIKDRRNLVWLGIPIGLLCVLYIQPLTQSVVEMLKFVFRS